MNLKNHLEKFASIETRLNAKADESEFSDPCGMTFVLAIALAKHTLLCFALLCSLEQRITGLEMRMADDDVHERMVAMERF